jgi:RNA polymerase sigma factor (sigma-70 family)
MKDLETLAAEARSGNRQSLERLVVQIQRPVYNLALRMLWHPEDARDASQEILVRVVTHLSSFRGNSRLLTWVYRIAANYLISVRRSRVEAQGLTFEQFASDLADGLSDASAGREECPADKAVLLDEVKIGCMHALLTCLDRPHRLAYVLGEILEFEGPEAARVLGISASGCRGRERRSWDSLEPIVVSSTRTTCVAVYGDYRARKRSDESTRRRYSSGGPSPPRRFRASSSESDASKQSSERPRSTERCPRQILGRNCSNRFRRPSVPRGVDENVTLVPQRGVLRHGATGTCLIDATRFSHSSFGPRRP